MQLSEQWVLVTGGARGLGQSITRALAREGAGVVINYLHSDAAAQALAEELGPRALALQADVTDAAAVQRLFAQVRERTGQPISAVVNNALAQFRFDGDARPQIGDITWQRFAQQLEGTVKGALNTTQAALPAMREQGFGRIVNVGTNLFQNPVVPYHDYTAAKAAPAATKPLASRPFIGLAPGANGAPARRPHGVLPVFLPYTTFEVMVSTDWVGVALR